MFSRISTDKSTGKFSESVKRLKGELARADAVLVGAGAGLSTSAGLTYSGARFTKYFSDFSEKFGITDMYSGGFYAFPDVETYWAWWSRQIYYNRYEQPPLGVYKDLLAAVKDKEYFVITTNVDHCFQNSGFEKQRLYYTQGDYGLLQCSAACHDKTYDNERLIRRMVAEQRDMKVPAELVPRCPVCGRPMTTNLRVDDKFVQDEGWYAARRRYADFLNKYAQKRILLLELGVGANTPVIIKYPFWQLAARNARAVYACINKGEAFAPDEIKPQSLCIDADIGEVLSALLREG